MEIPFEWRGVKGVIAASVELNTDPDALGCSSSARGLPACTATVEFPHMGYGSMLGWVQLVRAQDVGSGTFEHDPFALFADAVTPYCWYGLNPTLFDAPSRSRRDADLLWDAHSFLATTPLEEFRDLGARRIIPLAAFRWGFEIDDGDVSVNGPDQLPLEDWNAHTDTLRSAFPAWVFADALGSIDERPQ